MSIKNEGPINIFINNKGTVTIGGYKKVEENLYVDKEVPYLFSPVVDEDEEKDSLRKRIRELEKLVEKLKLGKGDSLNLSLSELLNSRGGTPSNTAVKSSIFKKLIDDNVKIRE